MLAVVRACLRPYEQNTNTRPHSAQVPLLPYLLQEIGHGNSSAYGRLSTVFSTAQVMGGLLAGACAHTAR